MKVTEITLMEPVEIVFPNGDSLRAELNDPNYLAGFPGDATLTLLGRKELSLPQSADTSAFTTEQIEKRLASKGKEKPYARCFVITGIIPDQVVLMGGRTMYRISSTGEILDTIDIPFREVDYYDYWRVRFYSLTGGVLVETEGNVLVLDEDLRVQFQRKKSWTDRVAVHKGEVVLIDDAENTVPISLPSTFRAEGSMLDVGAWW